MISEIAWLMEAFMEDDHKALKIKIKNRMAEVTESLTSATPQPPRELRSFGNIVLEPTIANQSPSMQRIMASNPDLVKPPTPVTTAAAQALAARQALLESRGAEPGRKSPRKA